MNIRYESDLELSWDSITFRESICMKNVITLQTNIQIFFIQKKYEDDVDEMCICCMVGLYAVHIFLYWQLEKKFLRRFLMDICLVRDGRINKVTFNKKSFIIFDFRRK